MRASQIKLCLLSPRPRKDARHEGETEQRLYLLDAWHESSLYTERERAALAWTCPASALMRQKGRVEEGRISGLS
jgi:alkylhydroperoxidase family enzyme